MVLDCRCKGISDAHTKAALATAADIGTPFTNREDLYAAALAHKKADRNAKVTGIEEYNGSGDVCGRCRETFEMAVAGQQRNSPSRLTVIPIQSGAQPARIGSCGKNCNSCASIATGCAPPVLV